MKKLSYIFTIAVAFLFEGCWQPAPRYEDFYTEHYIMYYCVLEDINLRNWTADGSLYKEFIIQTGIYDIKNAEFVEEVEYEMLCEKHGDLNFNREIEKTYNVNADFLSISVVSDNDYNDSHLAGTELGDIVMYDGSSPLKYIQSGYVDMAFDPNYPGNPLINHPINKLVSELLPDDLILIGPSMRNLGKLKFISEPTIAKTHNITVTMTADDGRVLSDTVEVKWE